MHTVSAPFPKPAAARPHEFVAFVASCMAMAALSIDLLLPAFPDMRADFGLAAGSTEVSRVITALFVGLAVGQLFYGPLSDKYGRKRLLYVGLVLYSGAAMAAAFQSSLTGVVVCRFLWGFGAAAPRSLALAMVRDTFEGDRMARTMSHVMATFILVPIFAPAVGAAAMTVAPWRIVFWLPALAAVGLGVWARRLPETLPVEQRRSVSPAALVQALRAVTSNRQSLAFGLAVMFLFGVMSSYVGSSEVIIDEVFGQAERFPLLFGLLACFLAVGSLLSGRLVVRFGLDRLVRWGAVYVVATSSALLAVALATGGRPPLWAFGAVMALMMPGVIVLVPNCNTAAMAPVPHVAGMAAAVLGTVSTGGGALLGSIVDGRFDGTVRPYATGALVFTSLAAVLILGLARPPRVSAGEAATGALLSPTVGDAAVPAGAD